MSVMPLTRSSALGAGRPGSRAQFIAVMSTPLLSTHDSPSASDGGNTMALPFGSFISLRPERGSWRCALMPSCSLVAVADSSPISRLLNMPSTTVFACSPTSSMRSCASSSSMRRSMASWWSSAAKKRRWRGPCTSICSNRRRRRRRRRASLSCSFCDTALIRLDSTTARLLAAVASSPSATPAMPSESTRSMAESMAPSVSWSALCVLSCSEDDCASTAALPNSMRSAASAPAAIMSSRSAVAFSCCSVGSAHALPP
mmetsp:Transcript_13964/g.48655  ORF Transcript_13964/g.48655 Transcript_13964/m.48655 type:complete len:258 (-) Transcript_13964:5705-6478(-)